MESSSIGSEPRTRSDAEAVHVTSFKHSPTLPRGIVIGYGNTLRGDDGVG